MTKLIRTLMVINGLIIPSILLFLLYKFISDSWFRNHDYQPDIIVGKDLDEAKKDSLAIQGISYVTPLEIYNSTNLYLPVSVKNYDEARSLKNDNGNRAKLRMATGSSNNGNYENYLNIVFLDKDYHVIRQLIDKKASITEIFINRGDYNQPNKIDESVRNIAYTIGFEDSNKDSKLNSEDYHDLFISDLDGNNLTQVTSNKDILDFKFIYSNSEILIRYKDRNDIKDEHKHIKFGRYNISTGVFYELKDIESKLSDIEAKLIR